MRLRHGLVLVCVLALSIRWGVATKLKERIYTDVPDELATACVRLLNQNGMIGCGTSQSGQSGALYPTLDSAKLSATLADPPAAALVLVMPLSLFTEANIDAIQAVPEITGLVVLGNEYGTLPASLSAENRKLAGYEWNNAESATEPGWMYRAFSLPIFKCRNSTCTDMMLERAADNAERALAYPRWTAELAAFMYAVEDAHLCLRRGHCSSIGGQSVWGSFDDLASDENRRPVALISTHFDSQAFFQELAVGAAADVSGAVALLAAIDALGSPNVTESEAWAARKRALVFAFFNGEAWQNMGSARFVRDLQHFECKERGDNPRVACQVPYQLSLDFQNLPLSRLALQLDVDAVVRADGRAERLYVHAAPASDAGLADTLKRASENVPVTSASVKQLPPTALAQFVAANASARGAVLSAYDAHFDHAYYHSLVDDGSLFEDGTDRLCDVAQLLGVALLDIALDADSSALLNAPLRVDCALVAELFECFTENAVCPLMLRTRPNHVKVDGDDTEEVVEAPTHYVSVWRTRQRSRGFFEPFIRDFMAMRVRRRDGFNCEKTSECDAAELCVASRCILATAHYHDAYPLAVEYDYELGEMVVVNESLPIWVESTWQSPSLRLYRTSDPVHEYLFLAFGILLSGGVAFGIHFARNAFVKRFKLA